MAKMNFGGVEETVVTRDEFPLEKAREDMERFLGKKVFLQLFVKVQEDWRNSERQLRRFGYDLQ